MGDRIAAVVGLWCSRSKGDVANAGPASKKNALHFFQIIARAMCLNTLTHFLPETSIHRRILTNHDNPPARVLGHRGRSSAIPIARVEARRRDASVNLGRK